MAENNNISKFNDLFRDFVENLETLTCPTCQGKDFQFSTDKDHFYVKCCKCLNEFNLLGLLEHFNKVVNQKG